MPAVVFDQVAKTYAAARGEVRALDGISFAIEAGEFNAYAATLEKAFEDALAKQTAAAQEKKG